MVRRLIPLRLGRVVSASKLVAQSDNRWQLGRDSEFPQSTRLQKKRHDSAFSQSFLTLTAFKKKKKFKRTKNQIFFGLPGSIDSPNPDQSGDGGRQRRGDGIGEDDGGRGKLCLMYGFLLMANKFMTSTQSTDLLSYKKYICFFSFFQK